VNLKKSPTVKQPSTTKKLIFGATKEVRGEVPDRREQRRKRHVKLHERSSAPKKHRKYLVRGKAHDEKNQPIYFKFRSKDPRRFVKRLVKKTDIQIDRVKSH
jgi:hypothetical protein